MTTMPDLSIVVPFFNEGETVDSTVAALAREDAEIDFSSTTAVLTEPATVSGPPPVVLQTFG